LNKIFYILTRNPFSTKNLKSRFDAKAYSYVIHYTGYYFNFTMKNKNYNNFNML